MLEQPKPRADQAPKLSAQDIRAARAENPKPRDRDFADMHQISEGQLVAAFVGYGVTRLQAHPDGLMEQVLKLGEVMALTRNESCVIEKVGTYNNYHTGTHAAMVLDPEIDLRIFPSHWAHAFAVERESDAGVRRSIQVFSPSGDAIHKVHLRETSNLDQWDSVVAALKLDDQSPDIDFAVRPTPEAPKANPDKVEMLRQEWDKMTDTHQFMRVTSKLKMNRLGAYRIAGEPYVTKLNDAATHLVLRLAAERQIPVMIFVGNRGCIEIHGGPIEKIVPMGPWVNVMDARFNLHLLASEIVETYIVRKPTQRGMAISIESFDAKGQVITQIFPDRRDNPDVLEPWEALMNEVISLEGADK